MSRDVKNVRSLTSLPRPRLVFLLSPIRRFMQIQSAGGIVLLASTALALYLANSQSTAAWFTALWHAPVDLGIGTFRLNGELGHLVVNDGLMTIFFFVVGMEIKRELVFGELNEVRKALLPIIAATGGMLVPALSYWLLQWGQPGQRGWAVPMATDIAFVVGILALFGRLIPFPLKILLLTLAIVDDLGAILVIAIVFTRTIAVDWLAAAGAGLVVTWALNRIGIRRVGIYIVVGIATWLAIYKSGVHPTIAGVLLGLLTPTSAWVGEKSFLSVLDEIRDRLWNSQNVARERVDDLVLMRFAARETVSPLDWLMLVLHPWVAFLMVPVFVLANAGVDLGEGLVHDPVALSVIAALVFGKPLGVLLFSWLSMRLGLIRIPEGVTWPLLIGAACLAGIGFTMALFLNGLSFPGREFATMEAASKIGILAGSLVSAVVGSVILILAILFPRREVKELNSDARGRD